MKVLVTGASGLLGRTVARALRDRGDQVTVLQRRPAELTGVTEIRGDIADPAVVRSAVAGCDHVLHLAAKVDMVGPWSEFQRINIDATAQLVRVCRSAGVARLVHVSSPSVAHGGRPLVGVGADPADPHAARGPYARSKAVGEQRALAADGAGFEVLAVRPHLVWGPGDQQLVARIVDRARRGRLPIIGSGAALVDTTYLDNAVDGLIAALDAPVHGIALVISNGEPRPIAELIRAICTSHGVTPPTWRLPTGAALAAGEVAQLVDRLRRQVGGALAPADSSPPLTRFLVEQLSTAHWFDQRQTRALLGWAPQISIEEGFRRLSASAP